MKHLYLTCEKYEASQKPLQTLIRNSLRKLNRKILPTLSAKHDVLETDDYSGIGPQCTATAAL